MTKIFCDIADISLIKKFDRKKIVKGFTTNPSLMRKAGAKDYQNYSKKILGITKKPISFEVFADNHDEMIKQGIKISKWGKNVFVYSAVQTQRILNNVDKKTKVIISIFAGRMADAGKNPLPEFKKSLKISKKFKNVEILWASTREAYNLLQAKELGCQIITVPPKIIETIENFGKTFDKLTKDTVKGFLIDSKKSRFKI